MMKLSDTKEKMDGKAKSMMMNGKIYVIITERS